MCTEITRAKYERRGLRYASDVTDEEWALIEPQLPGRRTLGRPREVKLRAVFNAILYIGRTGCQPTGAQTVLSVGKIDTCAALLF